MKSNNPKLNLRSMYSELQPDPLAISRLRERLQKEKSVEVSEVALHVFKRYVLVAAMILLVLTAGIHFSLDSAEEFNDTDLQTWIYGDTELHPDLPEYAILADL